MPANRVILFGARAMACLGGLSLCLVILAVCVSVAGREAADVANTGVIGALGTWLLDHGLGPILGDFELVEAGVAFAIFAFLPLCQVSSSHAVVDIFTEMMPKSAIRFLRMITEVVFAAVLILIAWKLYDGLVSKHRYGETTFLLQFPIWWAYAASLFGAVAAAFVGCYMAIVRIAEFIFKRILISDGAEAEI